jgi:uncharacterized NAD-dependent epimerase/dehydratase family protein
MAINSPYLLFLGDAHDALAAKVAQGIVDWRPDNCVGQFRLDGCNADCGLSDMTIEEGVAAGAKTLVIGVANRGGVIADSWIEVLQTALDQGLDLAAGLHNRLADVPALADKAQSLGRVLHDVRHPTETFPVGSGLPRKGKRVLPVGTDCSCGKMYTALALEKALRARNIDADFRATGQTGILICGSGVSVDAVVSDFISGATEVLAPAAADDAHWDVIEGQGSLFHPSFAGVTMGLIHGAQPDYLVLCHEPTRTHMRGLPHYPIPNIKACIDANLSAAKLTNPDVKFAGISVNTAALSEYEAEACLQELEATHGLPAVDPFRTGVDRLVDALL